MSGSALHRRSPNKKRQERNCKIHHPASEQGTKILAFPLTLLIMDVRERFEYTYLQNRYTGHNILEWRKTPNIATFSLERWRL